MSVNRARAEWNNPKSVAFRKAITGWQEISDIAQLRKVLFDARSNAWLDIHKQVVSRIEARLSILKQKAGVRG